MAIPNKEEHNKRKIDAAIKKSLKEPKKDSKQGTATVSPEQLKNSKKSSSQSKKKDLKIVETKNNSFSHGFN